MQYTSKLSLRKPEGTDVAEVHLDLGFNAQVLDDILKGILEGTQALDKIKLKIGTTDVLSEGEMSFDEENGTISYGMAGGVIQQIGEEVFYKVKNQTGATLQNGKAIRSDGSLGLSANMKGTYAIANGTMPPRYILGIATQDIPSDLDGRVTFFGVVRQINTTGADVGETWAAGDLLYVHPTTAGALTKVPPTAPKPKIQVAMVLTVSATVGAIFVKPDTGFYLEDLHNMYITSLADGDILTYDGTNLRWKNVGKNSVFSFLTNIGDLIYASGIGTPARLAAGTANKLLKSGGTANAPVWEDIGLVVNALTAKATPVDADSIMMVDSAASNVGKKTTWTQIKAFLKTYFDTLYNLYTHPTGDGNLHVPANNTTNNNKILKANATAGSYSWTDIGSVLNGLTAKATPVDADSIGIVDSAAAGVGKKTTFTELKAFLKTYFDTLYNNYVHPTTSGNKHIPAGGAANQVLKYSADGTAVWGEDSGYTHPTTEKATPIDADSLAISDSAASGALKKLTWANIKATLLSYFNTKYLALSTGGTVTGNIYTNGRITVNNSNPVIGMVDTDGRSLFFYLNSGVFHILRGAGNNSETWEAYNGQWPFTLDVNNNDITVGGNFTAIAGNIAASGNVSAYSDERLKDNIVTIPNALDKVLALRGVEFDRNGVHNIGLIAQEVQKVIPEIVLENSDEMKTLSVAYGNLVGLLIEAIKDQQVQIDELKAKVN